MIVLPSFNTESIYSVVGDSHLTEPLMETVLKRKINAVPIANADVVYAVGSSTSRVSISSYDGIFPFNTYQDLYVGKKTRMIIIMQETVYDLDILCNTLLREEPDLRSLHSIWRWNYPSSVHCFCNCQPDQLLDSASFGIRMDKLLTLCFGDIRLLFEIVLTCALLSCFALLMRFIKLYKKMCIEMTLIKEKNQNKPEYNQPRQGYVGNEGLNRNEKFNGQEYAVKAKLTSLKSSSNNNTQTNLISRNPSNTEGVHTQRHDSKNESEESEGLLNQFVNVFRF
eukprot:NODE_5445_length_1013_cov_60.015730_g4876_i0.p1 GENE.NODE_5445_length_1013_cov_60.015730_g4876_i0~~NODE_5445_length_1013_cov_60.015730_g4876_i0.p1  ORF type:complete len:306 (+),score=28.25 NODE_5445_length_1013_cov_60.015730_g4876_i0:75-920(+)